jgi:GDPmannose 4,6-dehydratase
MNLINEVRPDRILHGAGFRDIPQTKAEIEQCDFTNIELVDMFLNALIELRPSCRFLFLSSAEIFTRQGTTPLSEQSPLAENNAYSVAKIEGMRLIKNARKRGLHASSAICFNHDSFLSPASHLVRMVPRRLWACKRGLLSNVTFYDVDILRDWSHASDFARAFYCILNGPKAEDLIVGSGQAFTLKKYIELCSRLMNLNLESVVKFESRPEANSYDRVADTSKINSNLGWRPRITLPRLCREMIFWESRSAQ